MRTYRLNKILPVFFIAISPLLMNSCKKIGKEFAEKFAKESTEEVAEKTSKETIETIGGKAFRNLDFDDFMKLIEKDLPSLHASISKLDKDFQKAIVKAIQNNSRVGNAILMTPTIVDDFIVATAKIPSLSKDASFFIHYATHIDFFSDIAAKQADDIIEFSAKNGNKLIGKYKDGVMEIVAPFGKDGHTFSNELLRTDLIPNTLYKVRGKEGVSYLLQADEFGKLITVDAKGISPEDIVRNIIRRDQDINLGQEWLNSYKRLKQYSKGNDLNVSIRYKYEGDSYIPTALKTDVTQGGKKIISQTFKNVDFGKVAKYTAKSNSKLIRTLQSKLGIPDDKVTTLLQLMDADDGFANFIHSNPEFNVKRWLKTRNHVDINKVAKTAKGQYVKNGKVYAGNVYYFNPYLNPGLAARLKSKNGYATLKKAGIYTREELEELDKLFPNGVPFSKEGFPDFSGVAFKDREGKAMVVDIQQLTGDRKADIAKAEGMFLAKGYKTPKGYTWHHIEGSTKLMLVPTKIHQLVDHAGSIAMNI